MVVAVSGAAAILLGVAGIWMWHRERQDRSVYERNLSAFSQFVAPEFARGFAGAQIVLGFGFILFGLLAIVVGPVANRPADPSIVPQWVEQLVFVLFMSSIFASLLVTWLGRPKVLFPPHARDEDAPLKAWWARKRNRRNGS